MACAQHILSYSVAGRELEMWCSHQQSHVASCIIRCQSPSCCHVHAGESDAEFAARLASAISVGGGTDQEAALGARPGLVGGPTAGGSRVSSAPGGIVGARPLPVTQQIPAAASTPAGGAPALPAVAVRPPSPSLNAGPGSLPAFGIPEKAGRPAIRESSVLG